MEVIIFAMSILRNQTGIKHWKISPTNGKYTWGNSPAFGNIEDFVEVSAHGLI